MKEEWQESRGEGRKEEHLELKKRKCIIFSHSERISGTNIIKKNWFPSDHVHSCNLKEPLASKDFTTE